MLASALLAMRKTSADSVFDVFLSQQVYLSEDYMTIINTKKYIWPELLSYRVFENVIGDWCFFSV